MVSASGWPWPGSLRNGGVEMSSIDVKRWGLTTCAAAAAALLLGVASAGAEITVERTMKTGGFGGLGAGDTTTLEKISGLRKRAVSTMKMTGFLGKMAGDIGGDEITDIQKDVVWKLDHKRKTYTESKITPPPRSKEAPAEKQGPEGKVEKKPAEKPKVRIVRNEIAVKETGENKTIGVYPCTHFVITWVVETEDLETKERGESTMTTDLWTTPETEQTRALLKEEREYSQAWMKKIGWELSDQESRTLGLGMVGAMIGGDQASLKQGAKEIAAKMEKIKGFPIGTGIRWQVKSSGDSAGKKDRGEGSGEQAPDVPKGLGGLMAAMGRRGGASGGESAGSSDGGVNTVFDTYTEIRTISTAALPDADFAPPAGYQKVER